MIAAIALMAALLGGPSEPALVGREVVLDVARCPMLSRAELERLVMLELETTVVPAEQAGANAIGVRLSCEGSRVSIDVDDRLRGEHLQRVATFRSSQEDVTVRLVALAISELVLAGRAPSIESIPEPTPAVATPQPPPSPAVVPQTGSTYLLALGQALGPFSGVGRAWGGGLRLGSTLPRPAIARPFLRLGPALDVELSAAGATVANSLGRIQVSLWTATLRGSLRLQRGRGWVDAGAGARVGLARLEGQPSDPTMVRAGVVADSWAGPVAYVGLGGRFGPVVVALGLEGGRALRSVSGLTNMGMPIAIAGNWVCGTLAVGWGS